MAVSEKWDEDLVQEWHESKMKSNDFEQWMTDLPECLKSVTITHLAIPGTHDSMSNGISKSSAISPDSSALVKALGKFLGRIVKPVVFRWSVTQHRDTEDQLKAGVRYFDLRVAVHKQTKALHFVHGMYGHEISQTLFEIRQFLLNHQHEVVVLDFQHFYNFTAQYHEQLQSVLHNHFGKMMCPLPADLDISLVTLKWLIENEYQIIIIYRSPMDQIERVLWPSKYWPTPWPETTSIQKLILFLENGLSKRPINAGYITQCILTPDTWFVVKHLLSNLMKSCAAPCNYSMISWLQQQRPGQNGVNVIISDFYDFDPEIFPFVKTVVLLNHKFVLGSNEDQND